MDTRETTRTSQAAEAHAAITELAVEIGRVTLVVLETLQHAHEESRRGILGDRLDRLESMLTKSVRYVAPILDQLTLLYGRDGFRIGERSQITAASAHHLCLQVAGRICVYKRVLSKSHSTSDGYWASLRELAMDLVDINWLRTEIVQTLQWEKAVLMKEQLPEARTMTESRAHDSRLEELDGSLKAAPLKFMRALSRNEPRKLILVAQLADCAKGTLKNISKPMQKRGWILPVEGGFLLTESGERAVQLHDQVVAKRQSGCKSVT